MVSHSRLLELAESTGLYQDWRKAHPTGDVAERVRKDVSIEIVKGNPRRVDGTFFKIGFVSTNPQTAAMVTNRLAELFIKENAVDRENAAKAAATFIETQLNEARAKLESQESKIEDYRERFANELPTTLSSNMEARRTETQLRCSRPPSVPIKGSGSSRKHDRRAQTPAPPGAANKHATALRICPTRRSARARRARSDLKASIAAPWSTRRGSRATQDRRDRERASAKVCRRVRRRSPPPAEIDRRQRLQQLQAQMTGSISDRGQRANSAPP